VTGAPANPRLERALTRYKRIDGVIYAIEAGLVTAATALMTLFIFLNLLFQFVNGQLLGINRDTLEGTLGLGSYTSLVVAFLSMVAIAWAIGNASRDAAAERGGNGSIGAKLLVAALIVIGCVALVWIMIKSHPRWTVLALVAISGGASARWVWASPDGWRGGRIIGWFVALGAGIWFSTIVTDRFSAWTHSYALFLLLWMGFFGASMATSVGRHLRIDAARKAVPESKLARYNAVSFGVAAIFSGILCYLAWVYIWPRFDQETVEGELAEWLKILPIPLSLCFVTLRFAARSAFSAMGHIEELDGEVPLPTEIELEETSEVRS